MKVSKLLAMTVALSLVFVSACAKKEGGANAPAGEAAKDDKKPDTVKVWAYPVHGDYEKDIKELIADFNKQYPHIKVEYEVLSWAEGPKKFDIALNAGDPPDLYYHAVSGHYVNTGLAIQLDQFLTPEIKDDYLPGMLDLGKIQGKQYGLPLTAGQWNWGGNKRILEEAGVDWKKIQEKGWTWSEFSDIAKKMTKKLPDGSMQYGLATDGTSLDFSQLIAQNAGLVDVLDEKGKFIWNDDKILASLKFIDGLMKDGVMPKETGGLNPQQRTQMFYDSKAAVISKALPYYDTIIANRNKDIDAGKVKGEKIEFVLLPVPHHENAQGKTYVMGEGYVMFKQKNDKGEQHAKNAFLVMEALSGAKAGNSSNELNLPFVRKSQAKMYEGKGKAQKYNWEAAQNFMKSTTRSVESNLDVDKSTKLKQFQEQVQKPAIQALFAGEKTPEKIAEEFKTKGKQMFGQ
ncbi:ABC transporter substrate-binding protein [Paenibacillus tyrfis]|uniref:ABC transporter substrate-binding protein n=1 Tax=Paenibacillus tyrfis TaxID=1501230 RepID=UPI0020A17656|nr:extracellular solute-binding protein [Paenibacillus tyrfis]MCP1309574.1 extracellular solute-binding protein [Paenibacillus tyrfis]